MSVPDWWERSKKWPWWGHALAVLVCLASVGMILDVIDPEERTIIAARPLVDVEPGKPTSTTPTTSTSKEVESTTTLSIAPPATTTTALNTTITAPPPPFTTTAPTTTIAPTTNAPAKPPIVALLDSLRVEAPHTADVYRRDAFGPDWIDADGDCHNTRAEVLMQESSAPVTFNPNGCTVNTGQWSDPWSGFASTLAADFQIDHHVPLANAWRSGAWAWTPQRRQAFAQNLDDSDALNALSAAVNIGKGDKTPDQWKPPLASAWCRYAMSWARIKHDWNLTVTAAELTALQQMAAGC